FFFQAEDGIRDFHVTGVQTCALPIYAHRVWYVDPIDGTKDFIRGHEGFAVMIGLAVDHRPVLGVVYQPVHDRMFLAAGGEAWFQDRKSTRLNSSHVKSSYAVFCLKKK